MERMNRHGKAISHSCEHWEERRAAHDLFSLVLSCPAWREVAKRLNLYLPDSTSHHIDLATLCGSKMFVSATYWPLSPVRVIQHACLQVDDFDTSLGMGVSSEPMFSQPLLGSYHVDLRPLQGHGELYFG